MKIRSGFVSNSSSSSFICKVDISTEGMERKLKAMLVFYNEMYDESREYDDVFDGPYKDSNGKLKVNSAGDNSIPYIIQEIMENVFNAERIYLG